ncbi:unnamed protein product [Urochloa humidicola]
MLQKSCNLCNPFVPVVGNGGSRYANLKNHSARTSTDGFSSEKRSDENYASREPLRMRKKLPEPIKQLNPKFEEEHLHKGS